MDLKRMLTDLTAERDRIDRAIAALQALEPTSGQSTDKRRATTKKASTAPKAARGRRGMSPAARKRMSEMMKKRWAERRREAKPKPRAAAA